MGQNYKVYFSNRLMLFTDKIPEGIKVGRRVAVLRSSGKSDALNAELAISKGARVIYILCDDTDASWERFCSQFEFVQAAGGLVLNAASDMLFIFRKGKWDLPKGKVEEGENLLEGALREVEEECSISHLTIVERLADTWHTYMQDGFPIIKCTAWYLMLFEGSETPEPQELEGITEVRWLSLAQLDIPAANTYPSVMEVVKEYTDRDKN